LAPSARGAAVEALAKADEAELAQVGSLKPSFWNWLSSL